MEHRIDMAAGIEQLPPKQRATVHLFYGEDLTVEEIASALRIPVGTVMREVKRLELQVASLAAQLRRP